MSNLTTAERKAHFDYWVKNARDGERATYASGISLHGRPDEFLSHVYSHYEAGRVELFRRPSSCRAEDVGIPDLSDLIAIRTRGKTRKIFVAIQKHLRGNPHE